jgi:type II secretory pathway pseudopilin PulG
MKSRIALIGVTLAIVAGIVAHSVSAQQASAKRDFESEIRAALQSAKTAAGFEFLGTLVRTRSPGSGISVSHYNLIK